MESFSVVKCTACYDMAQRYIPEGRKDLLREFLAATCVMCPANRSKTLSWAILVSFICVAYHRYLWLRTCWGILGSYKCYVLLRMAQRHFPGGAHGSDGAILGWDVYGTSSK